MTMTTDITELAQREKFEAWARSQQLSIAYGDCGYVYSSTEMAWRAVKALSAELVEALEKAQGMEAYWKTQCRGITDHCEELQQRISELEPIRAAAEKLVRCKGRYHSEQNYRALAALFGVTTPDLPPLEHENVHYADAAEMEIAALRQRIAELESRTVNIKFAPIQVEQLGNVRDGKKHPYMFGAGYNSAVIHCESVIQQELDTKGIKWEAE